METNWWQILNSTIRFSLSWHSLLIHIRNGLLNDSSRAQISELDLRLYDTIISLLKRYNPGQWLVEIDSLTSGVLCGWARKKDSSQSQFINICVNGVLEYERVLAMTPRLDVMQAGCGTGLYGFRLAIIPSSVSEDYRVIEIYDPDSLQMIGFRFMKNNILE